MPSSSTLMTSWRFCRSALTVTVPLAEYLIALSTKIFSSCSKRIRSPQMIKRSCASRCSSFKPFCSASILKVPSVCSNSTLKLTCSSLRSPAPASLRASDSNAATRLFIRFISMRIVFRVSTVNSLKLLSVSPSIPSAAIPITVSGVRSSCEASATNSR